MLRKFYLPETFKQKKQERELHSVHPAITHMDIHKYIIGGNAPKLSEGWGYK